MQFDQYRTDLFRKLDFPFEAEKKLLDVGCGDGKDAEVFIKKYNLEVHGVDVYKHPDIEAALNGKFIENKEGVLNLPYEDNVFDYVYMHDVLHHVDEESQSYEKHTKAVSQALRVVKSGGYLIIVEGNRYNPLFYPHMVKKLGHEHFTQKYFQKIVLDVAPQAKFKYFETHFYPFLTKLFYIYEFIMENFIPKRFIAYNTAIIEKL